MGGSGRSGVPPRSGHRRLVRAETLRRRGGGAAGAGRLRWMTRSTASAWKAFFTMKTMKRGATPSPLHGSVVPYEGPRRPDESRRRGGGTPNRNRDRDRHRPGRPLSPPLCPRSPLWWAQPSAATTSPADHERRRTPYPAPLRLPPLCASALKTHSRTHPHRAALDAALPVDPPFRLGALRVFAVNSPSRLHRAPAISPETAPPPSTVPFMLFMVQTPAGCHVACGPLLSPPGAGNGERAVGYQGVAAGVRLRPRPIFRAAPASPRPQVPRLPRGRTNGADEYAKNPRPGRPSAPAA